jgi:predicted nucleic acid-binding Zn ribbon protein
VLFRELTRAELREIKMLVTNSCANYDWEYGCLLLDEQCYMLYGPAYTISALCRYFRESVLPLCPVLEAVFSSERVVGADKECAVCGAGFQPSGRSLFCSDLCRAKSKRAQDRESLRKHRKNKT